MQISRTAEIHCFNSWDRESPDTLIVVRELDHVQLLLRTPHSGSGSVMLSKPEAAQLGTDIAGLFGSANRRVDARLLGEGCSRREDEESGLVVSVNTTNRGEPYEEGVSIEIGYESEYHAAFNIDLSEHAAWELGQLLQWD